MQKISAQIIKIDGEVIAGRAERKGIIYIATCSGKDFSDNAVIGRIIGRAAALSERLTMAVAEVVVHFPFLGGRGGQCWRIIEMSQQIGDGGKRHIARNRSPNRITMSIHARNRVPYRFGVDIHPLIALYQRRSSAVRSGIIHQDGPGREIGINPYFLVGAVLVIHANNGFRAAFKYQVITGVGAWRIISPAFCAAHFINALFELQFLVALYNIGNIIPCRQIGGIRGFMCPSFASGTNIKNVFNYLELSIMDHNTYRRTCPYLTPNSLYYSRSRH